MAFVQSVAGLQSCSRCSVPRLPRRSSQLHAKGDASISEVYIGKGRYIRDDPRKYPGKEDVGLLQGATGGWAGGEAALWELREEVKRDAGKVVKASKPSKATPPKAAPSNGKSVLYVGAGPNARYIVDDATKYAAKEDIGVFSGVTGGFAGGEKGLKLFVEEGDVVLRPKQPGSSQNSPVSLAFVLVFAGVGGSLLLNEVVDLGELAVKTEIVSAPIDDNTKYLILGAIALLGSAGIIAAGRAALARFSEDLRSTAQNVMLTGVFWVGVFLAARAVLEL